MEKQVLLGAQSEQAFIIQMLVRLNEQLEHVCIYFIAKEGGQIREPHTQYLSTIIPFKQK